MNYLELERPHGFLIMRGKQTAIASQKALPAGEPLLIISDGEAFGYATLSQPVAMQETEFDQKDWLDQHCTKPLERKQWWPEARSFYVHRISQWQPFEEVAPVEVAEGQIVFREAKELSEAEKQLIDRGRELPKQVTLIQNAVSLDAEQPDKVILDPAMQELPREKLDTLFKAASGKDVTYVSEPSPAHLPLYNLALVRQPRLGITHADKKKAGELGEETMPSGQKQGSLQERLDSIRGHFRARFGDDFNDPWVIDIFEGYVIAEWDGSRYQVAFTELESDRVEFVPRSDWVPVTVSYVPVGQKAEGEKKTKTENGQEFERSAFLYAPDPGKPGEWKLRIEEEPGKITAKQLGLAAAALGPGLMGNRVKIPDADRQDVAEKLIKAYRNLDTPDEDIPDYLWGIAKMGGPEKKAGRRLKGEWMEKLQGMIDSLTQMMGWANHQDEEVPMEMDFLNADAGIGMKMVNGEPWHFTWSTNAFEDRDGEIFSTKSLESYVAQAEQTGDRGHFNFWHIPGTDFAEKQWQAVVGRFLVEAGPYLKNETGQKALAYFKQYPNGDPDIAPEGWGCSPEYRYLPEERKTGTYETIWITRTSTLPRLEAANIWTKAGQEEAMSMNSDQEAAAVKLFGADFVARLKTDGEKRTEALESAGVAHKGKQPEAEAKKVPAKSEDKPAEIPAAEGKKEEGVGGGPVTLDLDQVVDKVMEAVANRLTTDLAQPIAEAMTTIYDEVKAQSNRLQVVEQDLQIKKAVEQPRFVFDIKRATSAPETIVPEGDALKNQKPQEAAVPEGSLANHFFPKGK